MILKVDRKWSRLKLWNWKGFMGLIIKKEPFLFLSKRKREGGRHISGQFILKAKKNGINLKIICYQPYTYSFVSCFKIFSRTVSLRQEGRYAENTIILTPRNSTCLLRNTKPGTLSLHNKRFIVFTDLFGSVELIFRICNFDFYLKC